MAKAIRFLVALAALVTVACVVGSGIARAADLSITAASVAFSSAAKFQTGTCGATITAGQALYIDTTVNQLKLASHASASTAAVAGLARGGCSAGGSVQYGYYDPDLTIGATLATGSICFLGSAAGGITCTVADLSSGEYPTIICLATSTTKCKLQIDAATVSQPTPTP